MSLEKCTFFIKKKKRSCSMATRKGTQFCPHHSSLGDIQKPSKDTRVPCPFDPLHFCYLTKLEQHKKKCNARPKEHPTYFRKGVNLDGEHDDSEKIFIKDIGDDDLLQFVEKIKNAYEAFVPSLQQTCSIPPSLENKLHSVSSEISEKHFTQQASLLSLLQKYHLLNSGSCFIEFGAGKGQLMFWVISTLDDRSDKCFLLVDRGSFRYKRDNKFKNCSDVAIERIRIDIEDLYLGALDAIKSHPDKVVGISKHLCGAANDLALRCMMETMQLKKGVSDEVKKFQPLGLVMSVCCHHRCNWKSYVGKQFFLDNGFSKREFQIICLLTSWATCSKGNKEQGNQEAKPVNNTDELNRYEKLSLKQVDREGIGRMCKRLIDAGRIHYLEKFGLKCEMVIHVKDTVSPENVALVGLQKTL